MKKCVVFFSLIILLCLSGCDWADKALEEHLLQESGIAEDSEYLQAQAYAAQGKLDGDGYYSEDEDTDTAPDDEMPPETVHISFAKNDNLNIVYYFGDVALGTSCDLHAGDSIYTKVSVSASAPSSTYQFSGFHVYQYTNEGRREKLDTITPEEDGLVLQILEEYIGKELSIEPFGTYEPLVLSLRDYYVDDANDKHELSGRWTINDSSETGESIEISPTTPYTVSYEYDGEKYFYVSSQPDCHYYNNEEGIVTFPLRATASEDTEYSVELHEYFSVFVGTAETRKISLNDAADKEQVKSGQEYELSHLGYGDTLTLSTDSEWPELMQCKSLSVILDTSDSGRKSNDYKYNLTVIKPGSTFAFNPDSYSYEHGTVTFIYDGKKVENTQFLSEDSIIEYEQDTAETGYHLPSGSIRVTDEASTRAALEGIGAKFVPSSDVTVSLEQPKYGGVIKYFDGQEEITTDTYQTVSGAKITMDFYPWAGWSSHFKSGETYKVTQKSEQTVSLTDDQGKPFTIDEVFEESNDHKPSLEIFLDKSVGESAVFSFTASGIDKKNCRYESKFLQNTLKVVEVSSLGTEEDIGISIDGLALQPGKAVKILVERVTEGEKETRTSSYRLINDLTRHLDPVLIYKEDERPASPIQYKSIKITISIVDVQEFVSPAPLENASITVWNTELGKEMETGELIEDGTKVSVTITPAEGWYITGKGVKSNVYQQTMPFSKYNIDAILGEHTVEELCRLVLDETDPYGTVSYKLDKEPVSGEISAQEGQKLTIEYELTEPGYFIENAKGKIFGLGKNDQKQTLSQDITADMNGKTITREDFGISVVKEG